MENIKMCSQSAYELFFTLQTLDYYPVNFKWKSMDFSCLFLVISVVKFLFVSCLLVCFNMEN